MERRVMRTPHVRLAIGVAVAVLFVAAVSPIVGQTETRADALPALLAEVRALRAAMEQMVSAGPRVQLAMGRLQLQEQRVNGMLRRLDEIRTGLASVDSETAEMTDQLARLEGLERADDADVRESAVAQARAIRAAMERQTSERQRLAGQESDLSAQVASEQARWAAINAQLDELERQLGRR
jgi:hypothetical protein